MSPSDDAERPAIDLVSPLPPVRSGIADYSADLIAALAPRADLRLVRLPGQPLDPDLAAAHAAIDAERLGEDGRLALYQMGNNAYHEPVWELAMAHPGVLVLHDLVLHHFLIGRTFNRGDYAAYTAALEADHGWIGAAAARPLQWPGGLGDAAQFALPAHRSLIAAQRGVLTHSRWAADMLHEELPGVRVRAIPMGVPLPPRPAAEAGLALRRSLAIDAAVPLLGTFGFQTPIKRTRAAVRALATPRWRALDVHLLVGGEVSPACDLEALAAELGVAERVRFLGFLPFDRFQAAIAAVDLCLNLRYPTAGETSASLLRVLALGTPAAVSDHGQFAELSDRSVVKVPVGDGELEALEGLAELLEDRERLAAMGRAARAYVARRHRPEDAAEAVVAACRAWRRAVPIDPGPARPAPPTSLIARRCRGRLALLDAETGAGGDAIAGWAPGSRRKLVLELVNDSDAVWLAGERDPGGVALEVALLAGGRDHRAGRRWLGLPRDLRPGERYRFELALRRPLGPATVRVIPHVFGGGGQTLLEEPVWQWTV